MLGDFNGWVGIKRDGYERVRGTFGVNENGKSLLEVCLEWSLLVTNTMFAHKEVHMCTREEGYSRSIIDCVIVDGRLRKQMKDTRVFRGACLDSDNYLVISRIRGLFNRWKHRVKEKTSILERVKVEKLTEENVREELEQNLQEGYL
jgi:hypothetical protein